MLVIVLIPHNLSFNPNRLWATHASCIIRGLIACVHWERSWRCMCVWGASLHCWKCFWNLGGALRFWRPFEVWRCTSAGLVLFGGASLCQWRWCQCKEKEAPHLDAKKPKHATIVANQATLHDFASSPRITTRRRRMPTKPRTMMTMPLQQRMETIARMHCTCKEPYPPLSHKAHWHTTPLHSKKVGEWRNRPQVLANSRYGGRCVDKGIRKGAASKPYKKHGIGSLRLLAKWECWRLWCKC